MEEKNENGLNIEKDSNRNKKNKNKTVYTSKEEFIGTIFAILMFISSAFTSGFLGIVYFIVWAVLSNSDKEKCETTKAYLYACKILGILILIVLIGLISVGACFVVLNYG